MVIRMRSFASLRMTCLSLRTTCRSLRTTCCSLRMTRVAFTVTATLVGACAGHVSPPGGVSPDRPGFTDTPPALPATAFQVEAGYTDDRASGVQYQTFGETLLRVGIG